MDAELTTRFEITTTNLVMQCISLLILVGLIFFNIRMTRVAIATQKGAALPLWLLVIWCLPLVGAFSAYLALRNEYGL